MAYVHTCDRCGCTLREDTYVEITARYPPRYSATPFDLCQSCYDEVKKILTNPNAEISYNTPGAR